MSFNEILLKMFIIGIPEEFLACIMILIAMGKYEFLSKDKIKNSMLRIIFTYVIPCVVVFNIEIHAMKLSFNVRVVINILLSFALITILTKSRQLCKVFSTCMFIHILFMIAEIFTLQILINIFHFDFSTLNTSPWLTFIFLIPGRVLQLLWVYIFYVNREYFIRIGIYDIWRENLVFKKIVLVSSIIGTGICLYLYECFTLEGHHTGISPRIEFLIVSMIIILLLIVISIPWIILNIVILCDKNVKPKWKIRPNDNKFENEL
ncbi:hypothetical protein [Clostridium cylindrosporum]|uniref:Uncharacterized protein n=1 Tax=Clostridium cylindrosporum DSM 605 TaxID=1121307 RepID=A0A0J8DF86_CLOCY|nr:hypothetical protein [Clostridium cylindrosporum]KMT22914.1 hypothetical protein CLCY_5c01530 [Clostridium cylindrosporum DSM 605]